MLRWFVRVTPPRRVEPVRRVVARYLDRWNSAAPSLFGGGRRHRSSGGTAGNRYPRRCTSPGAPRRSNRFAMELTAAALLLASSSIHMPFSADAVEHRLDV